MKQQRRESVSFVFALKNNKNMARALYGRYKGSEKQGLLLILPTEEGYGIKLKKNVNIKNIQNENKRKTEKTRDKIKNR